MGADRRLCWAGCKEVVQIMLKVLNSIVVGKDPVNCLR